MREEVVGPVQSPWAAAALIVVVCCVYAFTLAAFPTNPDIAWLIEVARRWTAGSVLYRDVIEVNPPLAVYEVVLLSGGILTPRAYLVGVSVVIALSALWVQRLRGPSLAMMCLVAMIVGGLTDYGQRDHLGLVFVLPLLMNRDASRPERAALALWAFLGIGLKPYLLLIPLAISLLRPLKLEMVVLGLACAAYVYAIYLVHPLYLTEIVPLARAVYGNYGAQLEWLYIVLTAVILILAAVPVLARDREKQVIAAALPPALASFYLQGHYWSYHFVPALGLATLLALWLGSRASLIIAGLLGLVQVTRGPYRSEPPFPIPTERGSVAVLSADIWPAYPTGLYVRNATRYASLWTVAGAVRLRRRDILERERSIIRADIARERPRTIFADARSLDFIHLLGPFPGYCPAPRFGIYDVLVRCP